MNHTTGVTPTVRNMSWETQTSHNQLSSSVALSQQQPPMHNTDQLSPSSTATMDTHMDGSSTSSSAPAMMHSAPSSCTEPWGIGSTEREEEMEDELHWEQGSDDVLTILKLEPMDDCFNFDDLKSAPLTPTTTATTIITAETAAAEGAVVTSTGPEKQQQQQQKRPRGRPRKHPLNPVINTSKVTKGRSKTGCITCRKRKKKCDEAKPRCMNCEKNAVVCEGYHEKQIWKSGKEKAEEERLRRESLPSITIHPLFHGVETTEDRIFWKHYINSFSNVLTMEGESKNAFKDIILHLANRHQGLMHSILSVSSKHIDFDTPHGLKILQENPSTSIQALQKRSDYHHEEAIKRLSGDIASPVDQNPEYLATNEYQTILSARYGQILCLLLQTRAEGNPYGEHRIHLRAYQTLIQHDPPQDTTFYAFITEFFQYHIYIDDLMWHPDTKVTRLTTTSQDDTEPPPSLSSPSSPRLIGVTDGLLKHISSITDLRNNIRKNISASVEPPVDYLMLFRAAEINSAIQEWSPQWPARDGRNRVGLLYKQMMFIYLFRTIYPPYLSPTTCSSSCASTPQRRPSMAISVISTASAPSLASSLSSSTGITMPVSCPSSRNPSRNNSMHEEAPYIDNPFSSSSHQSPNHYQITRRRPSDHDHRLTTAVQESLHILDSFSPSEPAQTLLLIPCMIIGTACFEPEERDRLKRAIRAVRGYTGLRNCDRVMELLEEIWAVMDEGDWIGAWDWQGIARRMDVDILCT